MRHNSSQSPIENKRLPIAISICCFCLFIIFIRIWYLQIYRGEYYSKISEKNRVRKIDLPAPRGLILDRNNQILLSNKICQDLAYTPQYILNSQKTLLMLSRLLNIPHNKLTSIVYQNRSKPKFLPIMLKRDLSKHEISIIQTNQIFLPGIDILTSPRRKYTPQTPPHLVGHVGEISYNQLKNTQNINKQQPYYPGDMIGKYGLEKKLEQHLRGKRGFHYIQVDAFGRQVANNSNNDYKLSLPKKNSIPGHSLELTIDFNLQKTAQKAFRGKHGAIVALNPKNGEILVLVSSPQYDPAIYQKRISSDKWNYLVNNPTKPLYDKTTGGAYPPGSLFKPLIAIAAIEENIITSKTAHKCKGHIQLGNHKFHCYKRSGHGLINLTQAMSKSCDVYFYNLGLALGIKRITHYAKMFGFGKKLNFKLNYESPGLVPTSEWKVQQTGKPWNLGDIPSISIGQSANLATPLQLASFYSTIANKGIIWKPYLIRSIKSHTGRIIYRSSPKIIKKLNQISPKTFITIQQILSEVVSNPTGTGRRAYNPEIPIAGKTGSIQVVSLKKYSSHKNNIRNSWYEHAMFAAFSPIKSAEIVVVVVSEHDKKGGGGSQTAPIARKIIEAYWKQKQK